MNAALSRRIPAFLAGHPGFAKAGGAFLSGALMVPAMPPWGLAPLLFAGFSLFYFILSKVEDRPKAGLRAFGLGWLFGFGYFLFGLSWIGNALLVEGNDYIWAWPLAVAGLPCLLAVFPALGVLGAFKLGPLGRLPGFFAFTACLSLATWLRGHVFTGFPWNLYGYTWNAVQPVAQFSALTGIYGLTFLTIFWAALPGFVVIWQTNRRLKASLACTAALLLAGIYLYGTLQLKQATTYRDDVAIKIVQPSIRQEDKWNPEKAGENLRRTLDLSLERPEQKAAPVTLVIWPETALSYYVLANEAARNAIRQTLESYGNDAYLVSGHLRAGKDETNPEYFNSLTVFNEKVKPVAIYDKAHLVPFGEYIPLQHLIPLKPVASFNGFTPGPGVRSIEIPGAGFFSGLVCYEIIFPGAVTARKEPRPGAIINVTNDAWYGDSSGPYQHFISARFRAIEEGIPVIRAANTGISGIIDPRGRIIGETRLFEDTTLNMLLPEKLDIPTLYSRTGDLLFFFMLAAAFAIRAATLWKH